jgi:hypothetical protein
MPSEWMNKPWYPGQPTSVVLYETPDGWRFALVTVKGGIIDGRLGQPELGEAEAQREMLRRLRETDEVEATGPWTSLKPSWWSTDLRPVR